VTKTTGLFIENSDEPNNPNNPIQPNTTQYNPMKTHNNRFSRRPAGFTLVEVIAVCTVIGIMAGVMIYPVLGMIDNARKRAERTALAKIADEIRESFAIDDLTGNISALPGELPWNTATNTPAVAPTQFDVGKPLDLAPANVTGNDWYIKLARLRGQGSTSAAEGTSAHDIAVNAWKGRRVLYAGPGEDNRQRYILLSFMFPEEDIPAIGAQPAVYDDYKAWFDAIYDHDWGKPAAGNPAAADWGGWGETRLRGQSFAERVAVERIIQRRYAILVNNATRNNDIIPRPTDTVSIYANLMDGWNWANSGTSGVAAGVKYEFPNTDYATANGSTRAKDEALGRYKGLLAGRHVVVTRYATGTEEQMYSLHLNEDVQVAVQNPRLPDPVIPAP
jgi:prepilin-type N-terminal cleavage/methylation domain-containing protein